MNETAMMDRLIGLLKEAKAKVNKALTGKSAKPLPLEEWIRIYQDNTTVYEIIKNGDACYEIKERKADIEYLFNIRKDLGKTVFPTKEEAEKALAKEKENG